MTTNSYQFLINITSLVASLVGIFFSLAMTPDLSAAANKTEVEAQHAELGLRIAKASTNHTQPLRRNGSRTPAWGCSCTGTKARCACWVHPGR